MQITEIRTIRPGSFPNLLYVEIDTDDGHVGLGETYFGAAAVEAYVHETAAPYLLGRSPLDIRSHSRQLRGFVGSASSGAETRGNSAIDIALWDILGQETGVPLYQLLGGRCRERVRAYNTCAGYQYVRSDAAVDITKWTKEAPHAQGPYEDTDAFLNHPGALAESLLAEGLTGMKIWPFDQFAQESAGYDISPRDLAAGVSTIAEIRDTVGDQMEIMVELHGLWSVPAALRIARALEHYRPTWIEDPVRPENVEALAAVARATSIPVATGETLAGLHAYDALASARAAAVLIMDVAWTGGVTEAVRVAAVADSKGLVVTAHDCTGPVVLAVSVHLALALPNVAVQEMVRASYSTWYRDLVTTLPHLTGGYLTPPDAPGLGVSLKPEVRDHAGTVIRATRASRTAATMP